MEIKTVKISELRPHPKNPRVHPDSAIEKLERSIKEFGWTNPVLVSADGYVLAGHARLKAAEKAGIKEVPVIYLPLEGAKAEAYLVADNRLQDETDWDYEKLKDLLRELDTGELDLEFTGFDMDEIEDLMTEYDIDFDEFDGEGDGGGSYISTGNKVRVVIGALMFDINDDDHSIYEKTKNADADIVKAQIIDLINKGELL